MIISVIFLYNHMIINILTYFNMSIIMILRNFKNFMEWEFMNGKKRIIGKAAVSQVNQIGLPVNVRKELNINSGDQITFIEEDGIIHVEKNTVLCFLCDGSGEIYSKKCPICVDGILNKRTQEDPFMLLSEVIKSSDAINITICHRQVRLHSDMYVRDVLHAIEKRINLLFDREEEINKVILGRAKVSKVNQIGLPVNVREELNIKKGDEITFIEKDGMICVEKNTIICFLCEGIGAIDTSKCPICHEGLLTKDAATDPDILLKNIILITDDIHITIIAKSVTLNSNVYSRRILSLVEKYINDLYKDKKNNI